MIRHRTLDRRTLPTPLEYLAHAGLRLGTRSGRWVSVRCPVHKGGAEANPSMSVNLDDGHYRCFTCGVKGGDVIALHRLITGLGFCEAVAELGGRFNDN
jgi:DNA primase